MMTMNDALLWRYSPKRMTGQKVSEENIHSILKAAQLAPTSMGLQPFTLFLIDNEHLQKQIHPIAYYQAQIIESSHLLIFAAYTNLTERHIDDYLENIVSTRNVSLESLMDFRKSILKFVQNHEPNEIRNWAINQAYIALGFAIAEAALQGIDATPMEGFDIKSLNDFLGLTEQNLTSTAILAIGYRDSEKDFLAKEKKVRRSIENLVVKLP